MRVYISGQITGTDGYLYRFSCAEDHLTEMGFTVVNPAKVNSQLPKDTPYECYMATSLAMLKYCDAIYMLEGWQYSNGANREREYAQDHGKVVVYQADGDGKLLELKSRYKENTAGGIYEDR